MSKQQVIHEMLYMDSQIEQTGLVVDQDEIDQSGQRTGGEEMDSDYNMSGEQTSVSTSGQQQQSSLATDESNGSSVLNRAAASFDTASSLVTNDTTRNNSKDSANATAELSAEVYRVKKTTKSKTGPVATENELMTDDERD